MTEKNDLDAIKKLLILQLLVTGVPAELIGKATDMNPNSIRNMFQLSKFKKQLLEIKKLQKGGDENKKE